MSWFVYSNAVRLFFDEHGDPEYLAEVTMHECSPVTSVYDDAASDSVRLSKARAQVNIFPHQSRWRGTLGTISTSLREPILRDPSTAKVVIVYRTPRSDCPEGAVSFDVFLPQKRFDALSPHLDGILHGSRPAKMLITVGFDWFAQQPRNWSEYQIPTFEQFCQPMLTPAHRPYVTSDIKFAFARTFPKMI